MREYTHVLFGNLTHGRRLELVVRCGDLAQAVTLGLSDGLELLHVRIRALEGALDDAKFGPASFSLYKFLPIINLPDIDPPQLGNRDFKLLLARALRVVGRRSAALVDGELLVASSELGREV